MSSYLFLNRPDALTANGAGAQRNTSRRSSENGDGDSVPSRLTYVVVVQYVCSIELANVSLLLTT